MINTLMNQNSSKKKQLKTILGKHNLTTAEFVVLQSIQNLSTDNTHISQMDLCTYANTKPMNTSILLRKLVARKLVQRREHPIDTRAKAVSLTSTGKKTITELLLDTNFTNE
ncbi:MAG: winged helix DNA-binding protein [Bacteroidia bacterium]